MFPKESYGQKYGERSFQDKQERSGHGRNPFKPI
jgi:hypothetical protein